MIYTYTNSKYRVVPETLLFIDCIMLIYRVGSPIKELGEVVLHKSHPNGSRQLFQHGTDAQCPERQA